MPLVMPMMRIRTGGAELEIPDDDALRSMQVNGLIGPDAEIATDDGWKPLDPPPSEAAQGDDPWAAWNDVDANTAEQIYETYVHRDDDAAELSSAAVSPMPRPVISSPRVPSPPPEVAAVPPVPASLYPPIHPVVPLVLLAAEPVDTPAPWAAPVRGPRAQPASPTAGAPEPTPVLRAGRVLGFVAAGLLILGGIAAAIEMSTNPAPAGLSVTSAKPADLPKRVPDTDPLIEVERGLRAVGLGEPHEVVREGDLGDGILIDLQKLRLDVERVDAPVTRWVGRKLEDPDQAEVHVTFRSNGELPRELGAIALVVGRYKLRYSIDIPVVEAMWLEGEDYRSRMLDAKKAEQFFAARATLDQVLEIPK